MAGTSFDEYMQRQAAKGPVATGAPKQPMVYWGQKPPSTVPPFGFSQPNAGKVGIGVRVGGDKAITTDEAVNDFYNWSDEERSAWGKRLYRAGYVDNPDNFDAIFQAWGYAVNQAANYYTVAGKKVSPWDMVDLMSGGMERKGGPKTTTNSQTSYQIPGRSEAEAAIKAIFKNEMGRAPSDGELSRYRSMLTAQARAHPTVTTQTTTVDGKGNSRTTSRSRGGFDPQGVITDEVKGDPEYGAYQAATTYFNALIESLSAPGGF